MDFPAKYYRLNSIYLNTSLPVLIDEHGEETDLEPKVWRLILLFCQQPEKVITRDEIITHVYQGTVVSDNAVNKMVAKARKLLGDTPQQANFIKTVPKQGYSLIAQVTTTNSLNNQENKGATQHKNYILYGLITLTLLISCYFLLTLNTEKEAQFINSKLSALTHSLGVESAPHLSSDNKYLVYQKNSPAQGIHQWRLKSIDKPNVDRQLAIANQRSPIAWSSQNSKFLYVEHADICTVNLMTVMEDQETSQVVMNCADNWIAQLAFAKDEQGFYFTARKKIAEPWRIYFYSFVDNKTTAIKQPQASGVGNYAIDLSPNKDKLLILSSLTDNTTALYQLNLQSNELKQKGSRDWPIYRAIWHHDNERLVHASQRYARELLITDFSGERQSTLVSTSKRVSDNFNRHPNGIDFYFTSFQMNNDLLRIVEGSENTQHLDNSEVYEKLPTYAGSTEQWYFVSNRLGKSQIFLSSKLAPSAKQISSFAIEQEFASLDASPSGELLTFHDTGNLTVLSANTGNYTQHEIPKGTIISTTWLSENKISVSVLLGADILSYIFVVDEKVFVPAPLQWQAIFTDQAANVLYAVEARTKQVYFVDSDYKPIKPLAITLETVSDYSSLLVKAARDSLIYAKKQGLYTELINYNINSDTAISLGKWLYVVGFDVFENQLLLSYEKDRTGDVMRTHLQITN